MMKPEFLPIILSALLAMKAAGGNTVAASYEEARSALKQTNLSPAETGRAFALMKQAAEAGHLPAMKGLAYLYESGIGTKKSRTIALEWYRRAADQDDPVSQFNLAHLLVSHPQQPGETPESVNSRMTEGVEWYRRAADHGLTRACSAYGVILMRGDYQTLPDPAKAARYLIKAADDNDLEAMNALGLMYQSGNGVPYDLGAAETYLRNAAMAGHVKARANLGDLLDPNAQDRKRRIEAIAWLTLAEKAQDPVARRVLSVKGQAVSPDDMKAGRTMAAELERQAQTGKKP
jgi:TPR repeat protein